MARLQDKVALITGGESGIGLATARLFVSEGARVHLVGLDEPKLKRPSRSSGTSTRWAPSPTSPTRTPSAGGRRGVERFGRLDVVFSNAGISGAVGAIADYPSDEFARTLAVHVLGAFHILKHTVRASATAGASSSPRASSA